MPMFKLLLYSLIFFSQIALSRTLVVGVAPSLPKPVAEFEELDETPQKKSKFAAKQKKSEIHETRITSFDKNQYLPTKTQAWQNVLNYISRESGLKLKYEAATSQLDFELKLAKGHYDLAYITPLQFDAFRDYPGYQAQVKRKSQPIRGMVFVRKNGNVSSLSQLRDATIVFPGLLNFPGSVVTRESLNKLKFNIIPQFLRSEAAVYAEVAKGLYIAGSGTEESLRAQPPEIRNALKVIWDSPGFSPYPLVAHPRVDFFSLTRLNRTLVNMIKDSEGKKLLKYIFVENGFEPAKNSDWDEIKLIDLSVLNGSPNSVEAPEPGPGG